MKTFLIILSISLAVIALGLQIWNVVDRILYNRKLDKELEEKWLAEFGNDDGNDDSDYRDCDC